MGLKNKHNKIKIILIVMVLISLLLGLSIFLYKTVINPKLSSFKITGTKEEKDKLYVTFTKSYKAVEYLLDVIDENDNIIFSSSSNTNKIDITDLLLEKDQKVKFKVTAKSKNNKTLGSKNVYEYTNKNATFAKLKDHYVTQEQNIIFLILDYDENDKYKMELFYDNKKIKDVLVNSQVVNVSYEEIKGYEGKITAKLYNKNNRVIAISNIYLNTAVVGNVKITSPDNNSNRVWDDIKLAYTGGANSNIINVKVYKGKKIVYSISENVGSREILLPASIFNENTQYKIELEASYNNYKEIAKSDTITINMGQRESTKPVYVNKNFTFIKKGTEITLNTDTSDATIYYTTNGKNPTRDSEVYKEPITINDNVTIKAFAVRNNYYDSEINTYNFTIKDKKLVVYLSPSNQWNNYGVKKTGYTSEKNEMNDLTNYIEKYLKEAGVKVYRNKSILNGINTWLAESNSVKSDFHFAIHSNGSVNHDTHGIEIYVDKPTSQCLSIASNIYKNLYSIYPYKSDDANRGVKYANGSLGEANDNFIKCGSLIEVAYHDDYNDAEWIMQNKDTIGKNIAQSIIDFYQVNE